LNQNKQQDRKASKKLTAIGISWRGDKSSTVSLAYAMIVAFLL
jgi:hypothetical protein